MAIYNTPSDAANTAVRSFLTSVGEFYLGRSFNTGNGPGKAVWTQICADFGNRCAYCESDGKLQIEHLLMFNRTEYGLHHPGNLVPVCTGCNKRHRNDQRRYVSWQEHLEHICSEQPHLAAKRRERITAHTKKYKYPDLSDQERHAIRVIAEALYDNIKGESEKALNMYRKLDQAFLKKD
ncbi:HNH endonuclease [Lysobacter daejeonensis GH1-9]|uniref:HNH endonuclease n=1 Tax=Lysobacter daejeonensis GH1-9 TaxID=1385517 RepID=A0A0A0EV88_9GAMM|nr:hypothetical protein [Lysobacter daejeonensis]KGM54404.1 HNH endonuclease [Lysobacter daejeonensis GH1-9]